MTPEEENAQLRLENDRFKKRDFAQTREIAKLQKAYGEFGRFTKQEEQFLAYYKEQEMAVRDVARYRTKYERLRVAVRTLNKSMREKRYQVVRQRSAQLNKMVEELTWMAGKLLGNTTTFTWFCLTKEEYHQWRKAKDIQLAADRLAEELSICTNHKEPSVVKALTDYFKAKALP